LEQREKNKEIGVLKALKPLILNAIRNRETKNKIIWFRLLFYNQTSYLCNY